MIKAKQQEVVLKLVEKLGKTSGEEDNLNGSTILMDMLEMKEFYSQLCKRTPVQRLIELSFSEIEEDSQASQNAALSVLNHLVNLYNDKKKDLEKKKSLNDDEEDATLQQSDEEEESNEKPLIELLHANVRRAVNFLETSAPAVELESSYDKKFVPLGHLRLRLVEFIFNLLKLNNQNILNALAGTEVFAKIARLMVDYPWNNFLQLKAIAIFEEVFENEDSDFKKAALDGSKIAETLIGLSNSTTFLHPSNRAIRQGYMATMVKICNQLQKHKDKPEIAAYLEQFQADWQTLVNGELLKSNTTNNRSLGDVLTRNHATEDDDDSNSYEVNMERIMAKFTNFNSSQSADSN
jgi:hypothetical protein